MNNASSVLAVLHAMARKKATLLSITAFLAAIYVNPRYQVLLKYSQKTIAQAHLAAL